MLALLISASKCFCVSLWITYKLVRKDEYLIYLRISPTLFGDYVLHKIDLSTNYVQL